MMVSLKKTPFTKRLIFSLLTIAEKQQRQQQQQQQQQQQHRVIVSLIVILVTKTGAFQAVISVDKITALRCLISCQLQVGTVISAVFLSFLVTSKQKADHQSKTYHG